MTLKCKLCPYCNGTGYILRNNLSSCKKGFRHVYTNKDGSRNNKCLLCGVDKHE
jgi:hypothetical protein